MERKIMIAKMKKLFMVVAAAMVCTTMLALPTLAQEKPTIDTTKTGSITVHKYDGAKGQEGDGTELNDVSKLGNPVKGIEFVVTRVQDSDKDPKTATPLTTAGEEYNMKITTDGNGLAAFNGLKQGVYLVEETLNPSTNGTVAPFLVSIPMINPNQSEWMYDIHVYPKNEIRDDKPTVDKDFEDGSDDFTTQIGAKFKYVIKVDIPMDIAQATKFEISDTLDTKLTFHDENFKVLLAGNETKLVKDVDYIVEKPTTTTGGKLSVKFTTSGYQKMAEVLPKDDNGVITGLGLKQLEIVYTASINETALAGAGSAEIPNNVDLSYINSLGKDYTTEVLPEDRPIVKTGSANLLKVDADNNTVVLEGAEFKIFASEADANAYVANDDPNADTAALNKTGENKDWIITTDTNGTASFTGLAYGNYWIVETKAPTYDDNGIKKSYNLLKAPLAITVNQEMSEKKVTVQNEKRTDGFDLPLTGGMGTVIFSVIGISMMGGAALLLKKNKKKEN